MVNEVLSQLQALLKPLVSAPPLVEVTDHPTQTLPQWVPGQRLQASVVASLSNGRFQVSVSDMMLDMNLPRNTQPGENIELVFVTNNPRPTFLLSKEAAPPQQPADHARVKLSDSAKFLGGLLEKAPPQAAPGPLAQPGSSDAAPAAQPLRSPIVQPAPLLPAPPENPTVLAQALAKTLDHSGLFYESHQVQWLGGKRELAELRREPQAGLPQPGRETASSASPPVAAEQPASAEGPPANPGTGSQGLVHPDATPMVQRQLDVLDARQVLWQGQVWPGQEMEWRIEEREARPGEGEQGGRLWQTTLRLKMPGLGDVTAVLNLQGKELGVGLRVGEEGAAQTVQSRSDELRQRMADAGLNLSMLTVNRGQD